MLENYKRDCAVGLQGTPTREGQVAERMERLNNIAEELLSLTVYAWQRFNNVVREQAGQEKNGCAETLAVVPLAGQLDGVLAKLCGAREALKMLVDHCEL